ncbi:MAG TPA: sodium:solute symporter, partial [Ottowia sp.]|nr:sodium:solute symporter [Ottowia sp.]
MLISFIVLYLVISIAIGLYAATRVKNTADYAVAGRSLPLAVVIATTFATWFGSETVLGAPAQFVKEGLHGTVEDPFGAGLCLVLVGLFFARKLYLRHIITIGDYYRQRYGRVVEVLCSLIIIFSYLGWVGAQITALGLVFNLLSQGAVSLTMGMVIGTLVVLVYTLYGGMWSVALTDF